MRVLCSGIFMCAIMLVLLSVLGCARDATEWDPVLKEPEIRWDIKPEDLVGDYEGWDRSQCVYCRLILASGGAGFLARSGTAFATADKIRWQLDGRQLVLAAEEDHSGGIISGKPSAGYADKEVIFCRALVLNEYCWEGGRSTTYALVRRDTAADLRLRADQKLTSLQKKAQAEGARVGPRFAP